MTQTACAEAIVFSIFGKSVPLPEQCHLKKSNTFLCTDSDSLEYMQIRKFPYDFSELSILVKETREQLPNLTTKMFQTSEYEVFEFTQSTSTNNSLFICDAHECMYILGDFNMLATTLKDYFLSGT